MIHYAETKCGFEYGAAKISRCCSDDEKGWVVINLETKKHSGQKAIQIYVTKSGKVRIFNRNFDRNGEWKPNSEVTK